MQECPLDSRCLSFTAVDIANVLSHPFSSSALPMLTPLTRTLHLHVRDAIGRFVVCTLDLLWKKSFSALGHEMLALHLYLPSFGLDSAWSPPSAWRWVFLSPYSELCRLHCHLHCRLSSHACGPAPPALHPDGATRPSSDAQTCFCSFAMCFHS